jgi:DNA-binding LacI/PurR family transcriptional regulator
MHMPCVLFNKSITGLNLPCAMPDGYAVGRMIVEHLTARGRKRVACGRFVVGHRLHQEILMTMEAELLHRGVASEPCLWLQATAHEHADDEAREWVDRMLEQGTSVDALVVGTTETAQYAVDRMRARGELPGREREIVALYGGSDPLPGPLAYTRIFYHDPDAVEAAANILLRILEEQRSPDEFPLVRIAPELLLPQV